MRVVDTSAWIEWFLDSKTGALMRPHIPDQHEFVVPTLVQFELSKWLVRVRSHLIASQVIGRTLEYQLAPLTSEIAVFAAQLALEHKLATAGAIIYATAQLHEAGLLTCDAHFEGLSGVTYIARHS